MNLDHIQKKNHFIYFLKFLISNFCKYYYLSLIFIDIILLLNYFLETIILSFYYLFKKAQN
jgi:hypothetical protein